MHRRAQFIAIFICMACLSFSPFISEVHCAASAKPAAGKPEQNTPANVNMRTTQVSVRHSGTDTIGIQLSTRLKELFNASNLFKLNEGNVPKISLVITSKAEFKDRPKVGSVYSVMWVFSRNNNNLGYLIANEVDVLSPEDVNDVARRLVERTDGLSVKYGYLFK